MPFDDINIVPNPYVPENTIICGPRTYELLTGEKYDEALTRWRETLAARVKEAGDGR